MRALILVAATLALAGCGNNDASDNTQNVDENLSAENIVSNDVTAIDAVTGEAANMAADVELELINELGDVNETAAPSASRRRPAARPTTPPARPEPETNAAPETAAANATE